MLNGGVFLPVGVLGLFRDRVGGIRHLIMFFTQFPNTSPRVDRNSMHQCAHAHKCILSRISEFRPIWLKIRVCCSIL